MVEKTYKAAGAFDEANIDVNVKLYEDKAVTENGSSVVQLDAIKEQAIVASEGNTAVFNFIGLVTIEKKLENSSEPFIFRITEYDGAANSYSGKSYTVVVPAGSKWAIELPCGYYSITEDKSWAWKYKTSVTYNGESVVGEAVEVTLCVGKDGNVKTAKDSDTGDVKLTPIELCFTNERDALKVNWFSASDYKKNIFNKLRP